MKFLIQTTVLCGVSILASTGSAGAATDIPLLRPEEQRAIDAQSERFNQLLGPALQEAAKSTVRVWSGAERMAYGTVVGDGSKVLTKWSLIVDRADTLVAELGDGRAAELKMSKVYPEEDLALLELQGERFPAVKWSEERLKLGSFLAATQPDGRLAGFGVLSVQERKLRDGDQAFLGVVSRLDPAGGGVVVSEVTAGSGAALAGVRPGDVILEVDGRPVTGLMELRTALVPKEPGDKVPLRLRRGDGEQRVEVLLGNRPKLPEAMKARLSHMEKMGTEISAVRDSFSSAIQTDMRIDPDEVGGPVVDLNGRVIGITVARADRTRSFIMSSSALRGLLEKEGSDPLLAKAEMREQLERERAEAMRAAREQPQAAERPRISRQRLEDHIEKMRGVMEFLQREMDALENRGGN